MHFMHREHYDRTRSCLPKLVQLTEQVRYSELTVTYLQVREDAQHLGIRVKHLERSLNALTRTRAKRRFGLSIDDQIQALQIELEARREAWLELLEQQIRLAEEICNIGRF
jgi:hypothetical protein